MAFVVTGFYFGGKGLYRVVSRPYAISNMHAAPLNEIVVFLLAAVFIVAIFRRLQLSPVLGYLVAGSIIGPYGIKIFEDTSATDYIAEFGVVFLLFTIGLELTFDRLKSMRKHVFGYGTGQFVITALVIGIFSYFIGGRTSEQAFIIGGGLALSSTAVVLQVIAERGVQSSQTGRLSLATLILQDLAVVPLLIIVPLIGEKSDNLLGIIGTAIGQATIALVFIFIIGRQIIRPIFNAVASLRSQELFVATTLLVILGTSWATGHFGLSLALGAFVAGLLVAETEYSHQVASDIEPFKGLLMGLFFMTIGMKIDLILLADKAGTIFLLTGLLILMKGTVVFGMSRLLGFKTGTSIQTGFMLAQGSEFAFVLFSLAAQGKILSETTVGMLFLVISCSIALTPLMAATGYNIARRIEKRNPVHFQPTDMEKETRDLHDHVIIAGLGRVGKTTCKLLESEGVNYLALDQDPKNVHEGRRSGVPVYYGDANRLDILESLGIKRAKLLAVTLDDRRSAVQVTRTAHQAYPELVIVARAKDRVHAQELRQAGATVALAELFESSLMLGSTILRRTGENDKEVSRAIALFRSREYPLSEHREVFHQDPSPKENG